MNKDANVPFPRKLHDLIEAEEDWLIEWASHGECFFIRDVDEFCARVLAKYFRHTKLTSFQRQLNLYGFRRITKGADTGAYVHPLFTRDGPPATVDAIKRVRKGGAPDGRWSAAKQRDALNHHHRLPPGTSPNSPHHFPDHHGSAADGRPRSWTAGGMGSGSGAYFGGRRLSGGGGTSDDDEDEHDEDEHEDEDEYYPSGRRRKPAANIYSKPYFTAGSSSRRNPPRAAAHSSHHHHHPGLTGTGGHGAAITTTEAMPVPGALNHNGTNKAFQGRRQGMRARSGSVGSNAGAAGTSEWAYSGSSSSHSNGKRYFGNSNMDGGRSMGAADVAPSSSASSSFAQGVQSAPEPYTITDFGLFADVDPFAPVEASTRPNGQDAAGAAAPMMMVAGSSAGAAAAMVPNASAPLPTIHSSSSSSSSSWVGGGGHHGDNGSVMPPPPQQHEQQLDRPRHQALRLQQPPPHFPNMAAPNGSAPFNFQNNNSNGTGSGVPSNSTRTLHDLPPPPSPSGTFHRSLSNGSSGSYNGGDTGGGGGTNGSVFGNGFGQQLHLQRSGSNMSGGGGGGSGVGMGSGGNLLWSACDDAGDALMESSSLLDLAQLEDLDQFTFEASLGFGGEDPTPPSAPASAAVTNTTTSSSTTITSAAAGSTSQRAGFFPPQSHGLSVANDQQAPFAMED